MMTDIEFDELLLKLLEEAQERLPPRKKRAKRYAKYRSLGSSTIMYFSPVNSKLALTIVYGIENTEEDLKNDVLGDRVKKVWDVVRKIREGKEGCDLC